jgi:ligand-binding SRPBCC domain-containing protein
MAMSKSYFIFREQILPISIDEAWSFFSSPHNLAKITPEKLNFKIKSDGADKPIYDGMKIAYTVSPLLKIPVRWLTEIKNVKAPHQFSDTQLKGPYKKWEHLHTFEQVSGGVKMTDKIEYQVGFGIFSSAINKLIIERELKNIFDYRAIVLKKLFDK